MPVLPAVPSTITPPGLRAPRFSASRMMYERGAVLHRAARVLELGLAQDVAAGELRRAAQPDERRIADGADESRSRISRSKIQHNA